MSLTGKKILCIGGNGYIGNYLASRLYQSNAEEVTILSRSGPKHKEYPENKQINWIIGDIFNPKKNVEQYINKADVIVHTVGTLFDTSITKNVHPGGPGTYQALNRDSLVSLLNVLNTSENKKKIFYLSAVGHPPFIHRYQKTKQQAQQILLNSKHQGYIFKPGFVYNWQHRKWSIPLKYQIQIWNKVYPFMQKLTFNGTILQRTLQQFKQSQPTALIKMGDALIQVISNGSQQKILTNQYIYTLSQKYRQNQIKKSI